MISYDTVSEAVNGLKKRGYTIDYNLNFDCITCNDAPAPLKPSEFEIAEVYRFEGESDPADEAVVYAIEGKDGEKGVLVGGYGISADEMTDEMAKKLTINRVS